VAARPCVTSRFVGRLSRVGQKAGEFSKRIDEGATLEDADEDEDVVDSGHVVTPDAEEPVLGFPKA